MWNLARAKHSILLSMFAILLSSFLIGTVTLASQPAYAQGSVIYVDETATGAATGVSWTDAFTNVQDALASAAYGDQIWVAQGIYYPDEGTGQTENLRYSTFTLVPGVELYGGFPTGGGDGTFEARNWQHNFTLLSGDIDQNDITDPNGIITDTANIAGDNAFQVVKGGGVTETAVFDGFTVTGGYADGPNPFERGAGMYSGYSSPTIINVTFSGNQATYGGGLYTLQSSPTLSNVTFSGNYATFGGGMCRMHGNPTLTNVIFTGNYGDTGGGIQNWYTSITLTNVIFTGNYASANGGGMNNWDSDSTLTNVIFSGNYAASNGGGMSNRYGSNSMLTNVTSSGNYASRGGGIHNSLESSSLTLVNCILWANTSDEIYNDEDSSVTITFSDVYTPSGVYPGQGNINQDPLFIDPVSADDAPTTAGNYRLTEGSPAIDMGTNDVITVDIDLDGNPRIVDGTGDGNAIVDMGAYEFQPPPQQPVGGATASYFTRSAALPATFALFALVIFGLIAVTATISLTTRKM